MFSRVLAPHALEVPERALVSVPVEARRCWDAEVALLAETVKERIGPIPEGKSAVGEKQIAKVRALGVPQMAKALLSREGDEDMMDDEDRAKIIEEELENATEAVRIEVGYDSSKGGDPGLLTGLASRLESERADY